MTATATSQANGRNTRLKPVSDDTRKRSRVDGSDAAAIDEIRKRFGEPTRLVPATDCRVMVWELNEDADALVVVRLSRQDLKRGETAMDQLERGLNLFAKEGRAVRGIIVSLRLSGGRDFDQRPDFKLIEQMIGDGECSVVFFRDADRFARQELAAATCVALLRATATDLYLADPEGRLDWNEASDRLLMSINSTISVVEREKIKKRTHSAIERQYLLKGKGVASKNGLGFFRNSNGFLEQHPDEWPWIERIHHGFYEAKQRSQGLKAFAKHLREEGLDYSDATIHRILTDPIYVDGRFAATWNGQTYESWVENFTDGIPQEVFDRNQVVLAATLRRPVKTTPLGTFALNGVIYCGKCGLPLEGRIQKGRDHLPLVYRHRSTAENPVPPGCKGDTYERDLIDPLVLRQLLRLDKCEQLRENYWRNAWPAEASTGFDGELREREAALKQELGDLESCAKALFDSRLERVYTLPEEEWTALLTPNSHDVALAREIKVVKRKLEVLPGLLKHKHRYRLNLTVSSPELRTAFQEVIDTAIDGRAAETLEMGARLTEVVKACLSKVVVHRHEVDGATVVDVQLFGPKVPDGVPPVRITPPHRDASFALGFASKLAIEATGGSTAAVQTDQQDYSCQTVCTAWRSPPLRIGTATDVVVLGDSHVSSTTSLDAVSVRPRMTFDIYPIGVYVDHVDSDGTEGDRNGAQLRAHPSRNRPR